MKTFLAFLALILLMVLGYLGGRWLSVPPSASSSLSPDPAMLAEHDCDIGQTVCVITLPDGRRVHLQLQPQPPRLMESLRFVLKVEGAPLSADAVTAITVHGVNMDMGVQQALMQPMEAPAAASLNAMTWSGETILPLCSQRRMQWQARLLLQEGEARYWLAFYFDTER